MMLSGNNGILNRAGEAKDITNQKDIEERIQIAYLGALSNGTGDVTRDKLDDELKKTFESYTLSTDGSTVTIDGKDYETGLPEKWSSEEKTAMTSNGVTEITGDDISNDNLKNNSKIKAVLTGEVPITTEMTYVTGTVDTGVVVSINGSEFVWVPVPVTIATSAPSTTGVNLATNPNTERPMAILQSGSDTNYQGVLYDFSGTTSTAMSIVSVTGTSVYREPAYLNTSFADASSYNTVGITQSSLQGEYNSMVASVAKYGGFYVGRYELGLEGTNPVSKPASETVTAAAANNSNTNRWYGLYSKCKSYSADNLTSTMMWGSQYDAMMNWMAKTGKTVGTSDSSKYNTAQTTGSKEEDKINNVYDLYGCHYEWTLEANYTGSRVIRGGYYNYNPFPSYRLSYYTDTSDDYAGSRLSLYIK